MAKTSQRSVKRLAEQPRIAKARSLIHDSDDETLAEQRRIAAIPAPPFGEAERGDWVAARMTKLGLDVVRDDAGNVIGRWSGSMPAAKPVCVASHLDTVFPAETSLEPREEGRRVYVPGISDNARGLAALLAIARAVTACRIETDAPLLLVATTGEEGIGDLRGVKHLFGSSTAADAAAFIAIDGTDSRRIVTRAVGSKRYRVTVRGPGGHAWADRGTANPAHALGEALAAVTAVRLPPRPAWSLNVGRIGGGTSINAIPESAWFEIDLRSESGDTLDSLEQLVLERIRQAVRSADAQRRRGTAPLSLEKDRIGSRPAGRTRPDATVVEAAKQATRFIRRRPELVASSTDANVPMALGIPSIAIGAGGESGGMHTVHEWYANRKGPDGVVRALLTVLAVAGVSGA